ncbi:MAG: sodium:proton antiporter [Pararhodobacter sp.]
MAAGSLSGLNPVEAIALIGALGVGAQWLAFRLHLPAIVLMLAAGLIVGPGLGILDPARDIGDLTGPLISVAVAIILFEGGLTLNLHALRDAAVGVKRLVLIGAPVGWLASALALHYGAGLGWETSAVFGGIMIVTGPTVIAPLLRQARLARRPAALLQWEAIVNDPIGALAAVLAFEVVVVARTHTGAGTEAALHMVLGVALAVVLGFAAGRLLAWAFRRSVVPEYMKVPVLFVAVLGVFAASDGVLHESGLLAVTVMGLVIANANLPSYEELRRFKEHATVLLVSGVFILLASGLDLGQVRVLDWRAAVFVLAVVLVARPATVLIALAFSPVPWRERVLVALTGPRGVVLVAVAGLFGERLVAVGVADGAQVGALAFVLVAVTVVLNGFGLKPLARALGLVAAETPGVLLVGGSRFTTGFAQALARAEVPVLVSDANPGHLRAPRREGIPVFYGDILSEAAEHSVELMGFGKIFAATDNDAYNTLVATDLAPEFGRDNVFQLSRVKADNPRHALPAGLGGRVFAGGAAP